MKLSGASNRNWKLLLLPLWMAAAGAFGASQVDFNRDIRPLLSEKCYACHGPDARKAKGGLRLDLRNVAIKPANSGKIAISPGNPGQSELVRRIFTTDEDDLMPPPASHKTLTTPQKEILKRWIIEGAEYRLHWAYSPPTKAPIPPKENAVDFLVRSRLKEAGLGPSSQASARIIARRLYFDLVGLPPKPDDVAAFESNASEQAYEKMVEGLMASPHYGERMAMDWLDVVRFADTIGYHSDNPRNIWPYRDYVIRSFNQNTSFDRFTREQLAGDLLPNSTRDQKVASGFNRLLLTTEEGGAQPKDYEARQLTDRVRAVGTVWLGQTIGCSQCHDHKFDPITTRDFYSLGAFFADVKEAAIGKREDGMLIATDAQLAELNRLDKRCSDLKNEFDAAHPELKEAFTRWQEAQTPSSSSESATKKSEASEEQQSARQRDSSFHAFKEQAPELAVPRKALAEAKKEQADFEASLPHTLITETNERPRTVRILPRGDWMSDDGEAVTPAFPAFLVASIPSHKSSRGAPGLNRLDLANWLVSRDNPLTARVVMNRLWKHFFGIGLSKVLDDFGAQGDVPPNQLLLDWLACEFMDSGWDLKHMVHLIVTSATYRQVSTPSPESLEHDPENRLQSRQGRWRLEAELVRDNALSLAGLLDLTIGGPSVEPYQPEDYWENLNFPKRTYEASNGPGQYRRGLYTWWQRSFLHPSLLAFDAPSREECVAERSRSNVPQQALVLLHDPSYVEAARLFAARILRECKGDESARILWAWREVLARAPKAQEMAAIRALLDKHTSEYKNDRTAAAVYLKVGQTSAPSGMDEAELAAWTNVGRVLLNLHETITRF